MGVTRRGIEGHRRFANPYSSMNADASPPAGEGRTKGTSGASSVARLAADGKPQLLRVAIPHHPTQAT